MLLTSVIITALLLVTLANFETTNPVREVKTAYSTHLKNIESKNLTAAVRGYENNATVEFTSDSLRKRYPELQFLVLIKRPR